MELVGVSRRYGRQLVLRDLDLQVTAGRTVVLAGSNGAGKTTLLKLLATRLRPNRGAARVLGFDLLREATEVRRRVAFVSVLGGAYPLLSGRENLLLAATLVGRPGDRGARVSGLLERVGLEAAADRLVREYSSGMKKRLALARLLLSGAPLWLLDEPYAALDEDGKALVDELLRDARRDGRTVLLASHELERSRALADAVLALDGGRLRRAREVAGGR